MKKNINLLAIISVVFSLNTLAFVQQSDPPAVLEVISVSGTSTSGFGASSSLPGFGYSAYGGSGGGNTSPTPPTPEPEIDKEEVCEKGTRSAVATHSSCVARELQTFATTISTECNDENQKDESANAPFFTASEGSDNYLKCYNQEKANRDAGVARCVANRDATIRDNCN
jgi:hypothetical protein